MDLFYESKMKQEPGLWLINGLTWRGDELPADGGLWFTAGLAQQCHVGALVHHHVSRQVDNLRWHCEKQSKAWAFFFF